MRRAGALRATDVAWIAAVPCALLTIVLAAVLGPPLGRAFLEPGSDVLWPTIVAAPEPTEHARYLLSLLGPALLAGAVLVSSRWRPHAGDAAVRRWVLGTQVLTIAFVVVCIAAQYDVGFSAYRPLWERTHYFTVRTLLVALLAPLLLLVLLRRRAGTVERLRRLARETTWRRRAGALAAVLLTATWLLTAVDADGSLANTAGGVVGHILWSMDEPFAILNGRTPLVDYHAQYGQLVPYLAAATMALFGATLEAFTLTMAATSGLVLLAVYALLRRLVRSSLLALVLYLPFLATGFYMKLGPLDDRFGPANLVSLWPIRYGGPYVLAWLLVRHLDGVAPRRVRVLFLVAGLTLINNPEFGAGALVALAVGLLAGRPPRTRAAAGRLLVEALGGLALAAALVTVGTLLRSGSVPHLGWALEFSKLYGVDGWELLPLPRIGLYLVVYVTFAAAIAVAAVRLARRDPDVTLTAMLAWSGTFGLLAGAYFAGRSHPQVLIDLFSPWALSLVLLTIVAIRGLAARDWRGPCLPELAVLCGFALAVCSLAQTPTPWSQLARIDDRAAIPIYKQPAATAFVAERTRPGERIAILIPLGHRIAYDTGRINVAPYASSESMPTRQQLDTAIAALRREGGHKLFASSTFTLPEEVEALVRAGFVVEGQVAEERGANIAEMVDHGRRSGRPQEQRG